MKRTFFAGLAFLAAIVLYSCSAGNVSTEKSITDGLPVRDSCTLERLFKDMPQDINTDSPDVWFVNALCEGRADDVVALFRETKLFREDAPAVDTPYGRFEGLDGIKAFAEGFLPKFKAEGATFTPVFQTVGGGRICLEGVFKFVVDGAINEAPFFVCVDLRTPKLLDEVRMYTNFTYIPDCQPYRKPIWQSAHLEMGDPQLLTSGMRAYYEALHHAPLCSPDKIHEVFADECILGGYDPKNSRVLSSEEMSKSAHTFGYGLSQYIPEMVAMRYETIIDDGKTCVIEWCHVISDLGAEKRNRIAMSACSAYTRDENGYLCAVRICDYAGHEAEIDWSKTGITEEEARAINRVHVFPAGCGDKPQQNY